MNASDQSNALRDRFEHFKKNLSRFRMLLIVPTVICTVLALGYAIMKPNMWTARQSLVIRDDLVGKSYKPGRFDSLESLKSAQETILEIARKPQVIRNALKILGHPPMITGKKNWPSEQVIENTQGQITLSAPNGAEFGKTEVILISTKSNTRERSRKFIALMLHEIDAKLREVRSDKIDSMTEELTQAVAVAHNSFELSAEQLQEMDAKFGPDLSMLRSLNLQTSGDGSLQKTIIEIRAEQRRATDEVDLAIKQRELLAKALQDPRQYLVTSNDLLTMLPTLDQLVTGLSKAQLDLATKIGRYTEEHTEVKSSRSEIRDIKIRILREVQASIHGLSSRIEFGETRIRKLVAAKEECKRRLSGLSSSRVSYDKLAQEVGKKTEVLNQARQELAQVQSVGRSKVDLLTRVGEPQVATRPDGPGKRSIVFSGMLGGLLIGLGLIMFAAPPFEGNDQLAQNRTPQADDHTPTDELPFIPDSLEITARSQTPAVVAVPTTADVAPPNRPLPVAIEQSAINESIGSLEPILVDGMMTAKQKFNEGIEMIKTAFAPYLPEPKTVDSLDDSPAPTSTSKLINKLLAADVTQQPTVISFSDDDVKSVQPEDSAPVTDQIVMPVTKDGVQYISTSNPGSVLNAIDQPTQTTAKPGQLAPPKTIATRTIVVKPVTEDPGAEQQRIRKSNIRPIDLTKMGDNPTHFTSVVADRSQPIQPITDVTQLTPEQPIPVEATLIELNAVSTEHTTPQPSQESPSGERLSIPTQRERDPTIPMDELANLTKRVPADTKPIDEIVIKKNDADEPLSAEEIVKRIRARQSAAAGNSRDDMAGLPTTSSTDETRQPRRQNAFLPQIKPEKVGDPGQLEIRRRDDNTNSD